MQHIFFIHLNSKYEIIVLSFSNKLKTQNLKKFFTNI